MKMHSGSDPTCCFIVLHPAKYTSDFSFVKALKPGAEAKYQKKIPVISRHGLSCAIDGPDGLDGPDGQKRVNPSRSENAKEEISADLASWSVSRGVRLVRNVRLVR